MNQILTPGQMRLFESIAMDKLGLPGLVLMETAGHQLAQAILRHYPACRRCVILCGPGNNGGDGYAAARYLLNWGWTIECWSSVSRDALRGDARRQFDAYAASGGSTRFVESWSSHDISRIDPKALIVDGLLGTGLNGAIRAPMAKLIDALNQIDNHVLAIDIPSGVCGLTGGVFGQAVRADHTITFHASKRGHWLHPGAEKSGCVTVVDIGLPSNLSPFDDGRILELANGDELKDLFCARAPDSHKGSYGHVMVVGGVNGRAGAPQLASDAALASGAGLVTLGTSADVVSYLARDAYEVMVTSLYDEAFGGTWWDEINGYDAAVIGPGLRTDEGVGKRLVSGLQHLTIPVVIDADGLNHLARYADTISFGHPCVLTPHPGEAARLLKKTTADVQKDRVASIQALRALTGAVIVLKGANTLVADNDGRIHVCPVGNPGMATAGSGDVLAGMIAGLLAQGYSPSKAALAGTLWHGLSGDRLSEKFGQKTLRARDIIEGLRDVEACYQN